MPFILDLPSWLNYVIKVQSFNITLFDFEFQRINFVASSEQQQQKTCKYSNLDELI